jgi:hypothetical protein
LKIFSKPLSSPRNFLVLPNNPLIFGGNWERSMIKICLVSALLLAASASHSQAVTPPTGGPYTMTKQVIAGGGARASGGSYVLTGTVAQANAGPTSGASYVLSSGFHAAPIPGNQPENIFRNGFEN